MNDTLTPTFSTSSSSTAASNNSSSLAAKKSNKDEGEPDYFKDMLFTEETDGGYDFTKKGSTTSTDSNNNKINRKGSNNSGTSNQNAIIIDDNNSSNNNNYIPPISNSNSRAPSIYPNANAANEGAHATSLSSRNGLFEWSRIVPKQRIDPNDPHGINKNTYPQQNTNSSAKAMLTLPHLQDMMQTMHEHKKDNQILKVMCLDISSCGNIIVTGCEDGCARVWRFGDMDHTTDSNIYSMRSSRRPMDSTLQILKGMVSPVQYARWEKVASYQLLRLEGHVSPISDIHLNSIGDRVLTASAQDGNVRIWSLSKDYTKSVHIVLDISEEDEDIQQKFQARVRGAQGFANKLQSKTQVYNACWTVDDLKIITLQSIPSKTYNANNNNTNNNKQQQQQDIIQATRLKVWDSMTGDLLRVIWNVSAVSCGIVIRHPMDSNLALTAGDDGYVNVWDIDQEQSVSSSRIMNHDGTPAQIVDASFSPDGTRIAVTDMQGRVSLLSLDDPERYRGQVLTEQYFSSDYYTILLDEQGFAIDTTTQLPVHEAPVGDFCRIDGSAYANQPKIIKNGPLPLSREKVVQDLLEIKTNREKLPQEMERVYKIFLTNKTKGRTPKKYNKQPKLASLTSSSNGASPMIKHNKYTYLEDDYDIAYSSADSDDSDWERLHGSGGLRENRNINNRLNNNNNNNSDDIGHGNRSRSNNSNRRRNVLRGNSRRRSRDEERAYQTRTRAERAAMRAQRRIVDSDESVGSHPPSDEDEDDISSHDTDSMEAALERATARNQNSSRAPRRSRRTLNPAQRPDYLQGDSDSDVMIVESNSNNNNTTSEGTKSQHGHNTRARTFKKRIYWPPTHKGFRMIPVGLEIDREWLQSDFTTEFQYCPQIGDKVIYFPQGHADLLKWFPETRSPPWLQFSQKYPLVECEVREIQHDFPTEQEYYKCASTIVNITFVVTRIPFKHHLNPNTGTYNVELVEPRSTRNNAFVETTFQVTLRNSHIPDFIVLAHQFYRAVSLPWHSGISISVHYKEKDEAEDEIVFKLYTGKVVGIADSSPEWPHSPWEALYVTWDDIATTVEGGNENIDRVGLWEAYPSYDASSTYYETFNRFTMPRIDEQRAMDLDYKIGKLLEDNYELYNPFEFEVDSRVFPDYYCFVHVAITIDLIRRRLKNGYYRQIAALEFDVDMLFKNCEFYNNNDSEIVSTAKDLAVKIYEFIHPGEDYSWKFVSKSAELQSSVVEERNNINNQLTLRLSKRRRETGNSLVDIGNNEESQELNVRATRRNKYNFTLSQHDEEEEEPVLRIKRPRYEGSNNNRNENAPPHRELRSRVSLNNNNNSLVHLGNTPNNNNQSRNRSYSGNYFEEDYTIERGQTRHGSSYNVEINRSSRHQQSINQNNNSIQPPQSRLTRNSIFAQGIVTSNRGSRQNTRLSMLSQNSNTQSSRGGIRIAPDRELFVRRSTRNIEMIDAPAPIDSVRHQRNLHMNSQIHGIASNNNNNANRRSYGSRHQESDTIGGRLRRSKHDDESDGDEEDEDEEEVESESDHNRRRSSRRAASNNSKNVDNNRRSSRLSKIESEEEEEEEGDDEEEEEDSRPTRRRHTRTAVNRNYKQREDSDEEEEASSSDDDRRHRKARNTRHKASSRKQESEEESEEENLRGRKNTRSSSNKNKRQNTNDSDEEEKPRVTRSGRKIAQSDDDESESEEASESSEKVPKRRSSRRNNKKDESEDDDEEEEISKRRPQRRTSRNADSRLNNSNRRQVTGDNKNNDNDKRLEPELKRRMLQIIKYAEDIDKDCRIFAHPVDEKDAPGYYDIIPYPIDLQTIRTKLYAPKYSTEDELVQDLYSMYDNCENYNGHNSVFFKESKKQRKLLKQFLKE